MTKKYDCVFRRMVENLDNPIILLDEGRNIVYANRSAGDMFGDISGKSWEFLFGSGATGAGNAAEALIRGADAGRTEAVLADVTYDMRFSPVSDGEGLNYGVVMLEDVSEKRHLEDRLKRSMEKLKSDTSIAKHIQSSILPIDDEYWNSIKINAIYLPADDLGGDVFDIVRLSEEETLLYIADVSGHGVQASLLTVFLRENVRAKADAAKEGLELLVKELLKNFIALGMDATIYISLLLCRYNKVRGELSIANAGHNCSPLVIRKNGRVEEIPVKGMPISRISKDSDYAYAEEVVGMKPGDRIILYTDGVTEEYGKAPKNNFGTDGVRKIAERCFGYDGKSLAKAIVAGAGSRTLAAPKDDKTVVVAEAL